MYKEGFGDTKGTLEEGMLVGDRKAEEIMDHSATFVNGHCQINFHLERKYQKEVPDSSATAVRRLT